MPEHHEHDMNHDHDSEHYHHEESQFHFPHHQMHHMYHMNYSHHMDHEDLLKTLQHCEETCEHMTTLLMRKHDVNMRIRQIDFLRDCADICTLTSKYLARHSAFSKHAANLCAYICQVCGTECARYPDKESQHCARICLHCSKECKEFAAGRA